MTIYEIVKAQFPDSTDEFVADYGRVFRNQKIAESDWTQTVDDPTGNASAWATYRQQLRDLPADPDWPNVEFPDPPEVN